MLVPILLFIVGLVLLLVSLIFRYGAELEEKSGEDEPAC